MKKLITVLICFVFILNHKAQQDAQYNLYQFNQMIINPAYAGARDGLSVVASVRNQWSGFEGSPKTSCISLHGPVLNKHIGTGLTIVNDAMGPRNMLGIYGNFAYILKLSNKWKLSLGVNAGYNRFQFNFAKLNFKSTENNPLFTQTQNFNALDINSGLYLKTNTFFLGMSFTHMASKTLYDFSLGNNSGSLSYRLRTHTFITLGKSFKVNDNVIFAPTLLLKSTNNSKQMDLNFNFFLYKKLWLGVFFKGDYGPGFLLQYYVTNKFRVAYSYDTGLKDTRRLGGSHEVMIGFDFSGAKSKMLSPRFL
ncbi:MAG: type IX secretion system membrane protein PorP/SprF [Bacteroidota bacterium]|nr:type IX secretion system membrane protein PorP/SprF [Bacteroidota bacterium]